MELSKDTMELLRDRLENALEDPDHFGPDYADWIPMRDAFRVVVAAGTVESLKEHRTVQEEAYHWIWTDGYLADPSAHRPKLNAAGKRIDADLCRAGFHEVFSEDAVRTYRPKSMMVDGIKYEV